MSVDVREQVVVHDDVLMDLWDDFPLRGTVWASLRAEAARIVTERPGWALDPHGRETEVRTVVYMRLEDGPGDERMSVECSPGQAEFVRLRLACWAEKR